MKAEQSGRPPRRSIQVKSCNEYSLVKLFGWGK